MNICRVCKKYVYFGPIHHGKMVHFACAKKELTQFGTGLYDKCCFGEYLSNDEECIFCLDAKRCEKKKTG